MREAKLTYEQMDLFKKMNISEQVSVKRLMWMLSDASTDQKADELQGMLDALFRGADIKYNQMGHDK